MGVFWFKRFSVQNERSSMKVNTDGVLLGAAMTLRPSDRLLLDIGIGTGTIALMAAQRLAEIRAELKFKIKGGMEFEDAATPDFKIIGIDIDYDSAAEAAENFAMSPWASHLASRHISLSDFEKEFDDPQRAGASPCATEIECTTFRYKLSDDENLEMCGEGGNGVQKFNAIFSNPPYFESSLKSPDERKRATRHAETMSYREIIAFASRHLIFAGRLSLILPYDTEREAIRYATSFNLRLFRCLRIRTTPSHPLSRVILEFVLDSPEIISNECTDKENPAITDEELTIQTLAGYTDNYRSLVRDFLLI